jgi:SSS family solute:Na+ symporter
MSSIDWFILISTISFIVGYGVYKTRKFNTIKDHLKGGGSANWLTVGLSVMATQASAITFLSTPGQAFDEGMGFVQFYFGLPLAIIVICLVFIPIYHKLKVYTAYEYLEQRFDRKTRTLASILFLIQRGLGAGITIFAPAIILSTILRLGFKNINIYYWTSGNYLYCKWWNKSSKHNPKTTNVCYYEWYDNSIFLNIKLIS